MPWELKKVLTEDKGVPIWGAEHKKRHRGEDIEAYLDVGECPRWPECAVGGG